MTHQEELDLDEVRRLLEASEMELLSILASTDHGAFPQDPYRRGVQRLNQIIAASRDRICANEGVRRAANGDDAASLAAAIGDLLVSQFGVVPAITASVLITRAGIKKLCRDHWHESE